MTVGPAAPVVSLAYGRGTVDVPLHDGALVVTPHDDPALPDPAAALRAALRAPLGTPPLAAMVRDGMTIAVSVCDGTRAQPREQMLTALLEEIDGAVRGCEVVVLVATGTHRGNTPEELRAMLGEEVMSRCELVNHDARDRSSLTSLGTVGDGVPLELNSRWLAADLRITTGFVEPHFFAGFSGGPKMVAPGLAGLDTVMVLHDAARIGSPKATWGVVEDNPVHRDIRACAAAAPPDLALDVLLDRAKRITHVVCGELFTMHVRACELARAAAMRAVPHPMDVVVTTNSGFPLDQNLYQAVKGMAAAERVVRPGGTVVVAAECADGLPAHGSFAEVLAAAPDPAGLLDLINSPGFSVPDQWQVQVLARILATAEVQLYCSGLPPEEVRAAHLVPATDLAGAIDDAVGRHGPGARVCYLPEGPQTIPYLAG
ncbi:nickel-dependent lactate racemase [Geodermatophilus sabuli]|uniref:Nickel-dependent lactate racemase n=1 Tax=Geodermatophilus sabuli TaxID=1564158 RepID=A0A285EM78_9ACTN|nr:nickel-dependent lactate racemase [Geodermatophilus sabuli]MBB3083661.1 nickel-dependent lactate racemase [Geodermatophilus sabuli]SNX99091.1 Nickel-dependent lactate racemase [Geodermatophilus sabuli]